MSEQLNKAIERVARRQRIAVLNDEMRTNLDHPVGINQVVMTAVVMAIVGDTARWTGFRRMREVFRLVRDWTAPADDQNSFRDTGEIEWNGHRLFWKIDCFDPTGSYMSVNPSDPAQTKRILTIAHTEEW